MSSRYLVVFSSVLLWACGSTSTSPRSANDVVMMEEMRIVAREGEGELVFDSYDAGQLFERGTELLQRGRCRDAVEEYYDRIRDEFPDSRYVGPALYNAGLCLREGGEGEASLTYFEAVLEHAPSSRDARHAALQLAGLTVEIERWERGLTLVERELLRDDIAAPERLELLARRGQLLLGAVRVEEARRQARDALSFYRMQNRTGQIPDPYFAAVSNYVLAETLRTESEGMAVPAGTADAQHQVLDRRARLLLDAQREYFNTIRHREAEWAAAAGYRIGGMYEGLWHAMRNAPVPPPTERMTASTEALYRDEYRSELAQHIRPLLRHAIRYWELTLLMIERTGVRSDWADRTRQDLERMRGLLLQQARAEEESGEPETELNDDRSSAPEARLKGARTRDGGRRVGGGWVGEAVVGVLRPTGDLGSSAEALLSVVPRTPRTPHASSGRFGHGSALTASRLRRTTRVLPAPGGGSVRLER